jgi:hypothetical protein
MSSSSRPSRVRDPRGGNTLPPWQWRAAGVQRNAIPMVAHALQQAEQLIGIRQ